MSHQSRKKFVITNMPTGNDVIKFVRQNKMSLENIVFCGGEEYEIVSTVHQEDLQKIRNLAKKMKIPLAEIGYVTNGKNVVLVNRDGSKVIKRCGWTHLRS